MIIVEKIVDYIAYVFSLVFNRRIRKAIKFFCDRVNWQADKRRFLYVGKNSNVQYPAVFFGMKYIHIGNDFNSKCRLQLEAYDSMFGEKFSPQIYIGDNVSINYDVHIGAINKIIIGNNVLIASKVFITDHFHGDTSENTLKIPPSQRKLYSKGEIVIEDNVWIGEGVAIMPGVHIGHNSIIGANSVVTHDIEPFSIVVGSPANLIKQYK